jgi:hypothetical protein
LQVRDFLTDTDYKNIDIYTLDCHGSSVTLNIISRPQKKPLHSAVNIKALAVRLHNPSKQELSIDKTAVNNLLYNL